MLFHPQRAVLGDKCRANAKAIVVRNVEGQARNGDDRKGFATKRGWIGENESSETTKG